MHRAVTERVNHSALAKHCLTRSLLEAWFVDQRREVVLIGQLQRRIVLVCPPHDKLERTPSIEACRTWIRVDACLCSRRRVKGVGPLAAKEGKVAQVAPPYTSWAFNRSVKYGVKPANRIESAIRSRRSM